MTESESTGEPVSNFGDLLGPMILERILELRQVDAMPRPHRRVLAVGSILHFAQHGDVVWGAGVNGKVAAQSYPTTLDVRAVRGPYTRAILTAHGIPTPAIYGDPGLLLGTLWPELLEIAETPAHRLALVPNLNELGRFADSDSVSPAGDPWEIIRRIASSAFVTGTSLHALVVADALGIPSRPILPEAEHGLKYLDYYAGTGRTNIHFARTPEEALELGPVPPGEFDADALLEVFPEDVWLDDDAPSRSEPTTFIDLRESFQEQLSSMRAADGTAAAEGVATRLEWLANQNLPEDGLTREERGALAMDDVRLADVDDAESVKLSVVVPTHNVAPWVAETMRSILAQRVDTMEVIVVDDHSTDGTRDLLERIADEDHRVRVVDAVSRGGGTARNIGIDHARGDYLVFADGDDLIPDGAYAALVESLDASGSDIAFGDYLKFSPTDVWRPTQNWPAYAAPQSGIRFDDEPSLIFGRPCWNKAFRRSFWERESIRYPDVPRSNDIVPMVTAYLAAKTVDVVEQVVYLYRERPGTSSMTSRAGSPESLVSYLGQELGCARLIARSASSKLLAPYRSLVLDRDGWVHLAKHLRGEERDTSHDDEIVSLFTEILDTIGANAADARERHKRLVYALLLAGDVDGASAAVRLFAAPQLESEPLLTDWHRLLDACERAGIDVGEVYPAFAHSLSESLFMAVVGGPAGDDDALIALARRLDADGYFQLARSVPEFADIAEVDDAELIARLAESRAVGATVTAVSAGSILRVSMEYRGAEGRYSPLLYEAAHATVRRPAAFSRTSGGERGFASASFPALVLPKHRRFVFALRNQQSGRLLTAHAIADMPEYSRFDSFDHHTDRRGGTLARRDGWLRRGVRQAIRRLRG